MSTMLLQLIVVQRMLSFVVVAAGIYRQAAEQPSDLPANQCATVAVTAHGASTVLEACDAACMLYVVPQRQGSILSLCCT